MRRFLILLVILAVLGAGAFFAEQWEFFAPGPQAARGTATMIWIKPSTASARIAQQLQAAGVVRNAALFRLGIWLRHQNAALKAGEYAVSSGASMADVMGILVGGKSIQHRLTAAEGLTSAMIYDVVRRSPSLMGEARDVPPEGSLLPETYLFVRGTTREQMLARMARAQQKLIARIWSSRAQDLPFTSPEQAVTLASVVEKETALPEERRHIAAVFINRLRLGMKLQSDPTVIYGITKGYPLGRGIRESELSADTPYNTYERTGFPPTPICNPGTDSIKAVIQPEVSSDLYFVANGTGGHVFSTSIVEHEKNVARWRQIERAHEAAAPPPPPAGLLRSDADDSGLTVANAPALRKHRPRHRHRR